MKCGVLWSDVVYGLMRLTILSVWRAVGGAGAFEHLLRPSRDRPAVLYFRAVANPFNPLFAQHKSYERISETGSRG